MNRVLELGGPGIGVSVSASVLPMNIQGWFAFYVRMHYMYTIYIIYMLYNVYNMYTVYTGEDIWEKGMATHASTAAWGIPWTETLVGCSPWGCKGRT